MFTESSLSCGGVRAGMGILFHRVHNWFKDVGSGVIKNPVCTFAGFDLSLSFFLAKTVPTWLNLADIALGILEVLKLLHCVNVVIQVTRDYGAYFFITSKTINVKF